MMMLDIVLLGPPGAGKGTQAELLAKWLELPRVSSGDLFRAAIGQGTRLGLEAKSYLDRGELVPDEVTVAMVAERVAQPDCARGVIFDGFPRTAAQAEALRTMLAELGRRVDRAIYIRVATVLLLQRLSGRWTCRKCGTAYHRAFSPEKREGVCDVCSGELYQRNDDTPETQSRRIQVYLEQTSPLIEYYRQRGLLAEIDGEQEIAAVQHDLAAVVEAVLSHEGRRL